MIAPLRLLAVTAALLSVTQAQPIPNQVLVATEPMTAKDFTVWEEADATSYEGTYEGDVGGDSGGKFVFKLGKAKKQALPIMASGSYSQTPAGSATMLVKFENAFNYGDEPGVFEAGAFKIIFVKFGKTKGVIVGSLFLPKA